MDSKYTIGRVHKVYPNKLIIEIPDTKEIDFVYNGEFYQTKGINTYVTIYQESGNRFVFQITGMYEQEKALIEEEESKLLSHAYFECVPIGEIDQGTFEYGLLNYPMIGDGVYLTSSTDLDIIFNKTDHSVKLGVLPSQNNYNPDISLDGLFTHHTSILGNTSSGKSTTARKLIQSLEQNKGIDKQKLNFLIFDIHDEYDFIKDENIMKTIHIEDIAIDLKSLTIEDWINLVRPSDKVQLPILNQALRLAHIMQYDDELHNAIKIYCAVETFKRHPTDGVVKRNLVINLLSDSDFNATVNFNLAEKYHELYANIKDEHIEGFYNHVEKYYFTKFSFTYKEFHPYLLDELSKSSPEINSLDNLLMGIDYLFIIEESHGNRNIRNHTSTLVTRIEEIKSRYENNLFNQSETKKQELNEIITLNCTQPFVRFDISSLLNEDLLFFSSYILEQLFKTQINNKDDKKLVHCIFDEAHQYIREHFQEERLQTLQVFEKVAREGRKFGLFMIVISQRPSELSQTVLSQCNNFILHRIRNGVDLEFMRKSIPYITNHQLVRLAYMKSGTALLVGEAFTIPMELKINADDEIKNITETYLPSEVWL